MNSRILLLTAGLLVAIGVSAQDKKSKTIGVGDKIPAIVLKDQDGKTFNSADYLGKNNLVIFFYPKDESLVCTKEACAFRDNYDEFTKTGAVIIGINGGTSDSHKNFQLKEKLPYRLLSDPGNKMIQAFGVPGKLFMTGRKTFVVDKNGKVVFTYDSSLNGSKHAEETLGFLRK